MKKLSLILCLLVLVLTFTACNPASTSPGTTTPVTSNSETTAAPTTTLGEPAQLVLYMSSAGVTIEDNQLVADEINKIIKPLINAEISLNFINMGSWAEQTGLMVRSGDQIDVMMAFEAHARNYLSQDALVPLNDLLDQYGQDLVKQVGQQYIDVGKIGDTIYLIPSMKDMATGRTFVYSKQMASDVGVDMSKVDSIDDLTSIFASVKAKYPEVNPFGGAGGSKIIFNNWSWDALSDSMGVLMDRGAALKVENLFASDEYKSLLKLMRSWYQAGYIEKDFTTSSETWATRLKAKTTFGGITTLKPGAEVEASRNVGFELGSAILLTPFAITGNVINVNWVIPVNTIDEVKAMQFLNLMYSNADVANLLHNGIEGVHYSTDSQGFITRLNPETNKYIQNLSWAFGNQFITKVWAGNAADIWEQTRKFNESAIKSKAFGFAFDNSSVVNELTACNNVSDKYRASLETGSVDPDATLPQFLSELEAAGIGKIIAAKQTQLDAWAAK